MQDFSFPYLIYELKWTKSLAYLKNILLLPAKLDWNALGMD